MEWWETSTQNRQVGLYFKTRLSLRSLTLLSLKCSLDNGYINIMKSLPRQESGARLGCSRSSCRRSATAPPWPWRSGRRGRGAGWRTGALFLSYFSITMACLMSRNMTKMTYIIYSFSSIVNVTCGYEFMTQ